MRLADAKNVEIAPWQTGFSTGLKITLSNWPQAQKLSLFLTVALQGPDEDLVFDVSAQEQDVAVRQLDWPTALDGRDVDCTLLSNHRGVLLPRNWPKPYFPDRATNPDGTAKASDASIIQANNIECWSMSWWGFQKGSSAMMVIVETPNDAAYQFDHPAGGPTTIGPRWLASLGHFAYPRRCRFCFFPQGNYVTMAQRYRRYVMDRGTFLSLADKIGQRPVVAQLIGTPTTRLNILTDIVTSSLRYSTTQPEKNHSLHTFDQQIELLRRLKAGGVERMSVVLTGWPTHGYDRQHPDELPPPPAAGGWEGMKRFADACKGLGYVLSLHDQYRDFYVDAASYDPQFAIHEEDAATPSTAFAGSRFGQWKEGVIPFMNNWDGGEQTYLSPRFMPGHLMKNYQEMFDHGIHPQGIYLDVFGYVPPDEDFNPEHPTTRTQSLAARADCFTWSRQNIGLVGTEAGCDWTIPYADYSTPLRSNKGVPVPLFNLVYHDAMITQYDPGDLRGFLNGGEPTFNVSREWTAADRENVRRMCALHKRVALESMVNHEFLDANYRRERTTFSDGTTVTVDWDKNTVQIQPDVTPDSPASTAPAEN